MRPPGSAWHARYIESTRALHYVDQLALRSVMNAMQWRLGFAERWSSATFIGAAVFTRNLGPYIANQNVQWRAIGSRRGVTANVLRYPPLQHGDGF